MEKSGKEVDHIASVHLKNLQIIIEGKANILDVRKQSEFLSEHVDGAINAPLILSMIIYSFNKNEPYYVHCAGGYRSMIFSSVLKARGFDNLIDVDGGFKAIKESGKVGVTDFVCPTTLSKK